jgi:DNA-binding beta-propeller fold protein YncE
MPVIRKDFTPTPTHTPTPTPSPTPAPAPQWVADVELPGASCPVSVGVNEFTGIIYVPNTHSANVSLVQDLAFLGNTATSKTPTLVEPVPNSPYTYVTNLSDLGPEARQIAYFNGPVLEQMLPDYFEPVDVIYNIVNGWTYVSDLDSTIRVFDGATLLGDIHIPNGGWLLTLAVDEVTGYVYTAGWEKGTVHVIEDMTVIETFDAGWGGYHIEIDQDTGFIYLAHSEPSAERTQNITIFHRDDRTLTAYQTSTRSLDVAVDKDGFAYFPNFLSNTVTVVKGRDLIGTFEVGESPRMVDSNHTTGYTMVSLAGENEVALFKSAVFLGTLPAGEQPWFVEANETTGEFYVANRNYYIACDDVERCYEICELATLSVYK